MKFGLAQYKLAVSPEWREQAQRERAARHAESGRKEREQQDIHRTHPQRESSKTCIALALASERDSVSGRVRDR